MPLLMSSTLAPGSMPSLCSPSLSSCTLKLCSFARVLPGYASCRHLQPANTTSWAHDDDTQHQVASTPVMRCKPGCYSPEVKAGTWGCPWLPPTRMMTLLTSMHGFAWRIAQNVQLATRPLHHPVHLPLPHREHCFIDPPLLRCVVSVHRPGASDVRGVPKVLTPRVHQHNLSIVNLHMHISHSAD